MKKVILIVTKNGMKYHIGINKEVSEVLDEIKSCESSFYQIIDNCAIKVEEIVSVEKYEYTTNREEIVNAEY